MAFDPGLSVLRGVPEPEPKVESRRLADVTVVSFHGHENDGVRSEPAAFVVSFCRAMVDAGADMGDPVPLSVKGLARLGLATLPCFTSYAHHCKLY